MNTLGRLVLFCALVLSWTNVSCFSSNNNLHRLSVTRTVRSAAFVPRTTLPVVGGQSPTALFGKKEARAKGNERKNKTQRVRKPKDDVIEVEATVLESLPNAMFRCTIDGVAESEPILATISGKIRKNFVKILVGDKVTIELSPYDLTRGRITFRHRS